MGGNTSHDPRVLQTPGSLAWKTSRNGAASDSLGILRDLAWSPHIPQGSEFCFQGGSVDGERMENWDLHPSGILDNLSVEMSLPWPWIPFPGLVFSFQKDFPELSPPFLRSKPGILPATRTRGESLPIPYFSLWKNQDQPGPASSLHKTNSKPPQLLLQVGISWKITGSKGLGEPGSRNIPECRESEAGRRPSPELSPGAAGTRTQKPRERGWRSHWM